MDKKQQEALEQHPIVQTVIEYQNGVTDGDAGGFAEWHSFREFYQKWMRSETDRSRYPDDYANLRLAVYLAAFGMYRGSGFLRRGTHAIHQRAWSVLDRESLAELQDCDFQTAFNKAGQISDLVGKLTTAYEPLKSRSRSAVKEGIKPAADQCDGSPLSPEQDALKTLTTKVVLGTVVCLPAYDAYACFAVRKLGIGPPKTDVSGLERLFGFALEHQREFEAAAKEVGNPPLIRVLDMYLWRIGAVDAEKKSATRKEESEKWRATEKETRELKRGPIRTKNI
ncbi:hypothetical protein [Thalassobaculum salexigens]|uniref:hypothetical protein n=1 Tax=Thalassobaculum salexigens TaxID=455360 RepID=UPI0012EC61C3|nr:hypothetical protein [Thalassobaculum salexigens]